MKIPLIPGIENALKNHRKNVHTNEIYGTHLCSTNLLDYPIECNLKKEEQISRKFRNSARNASDLNM